MFIDELTPLFRELTAQPLAFAGGFFSGLFRLNLAEDPVKTWLDQQSGTSSYSTTNSSNGSSNGGPQSISID
ncbi:hypothetical protein H6F93_30695 [Leptolyngbya sp. FACHB-671]|uniref:hypothetical protein n=1 Tax=unclassified Leptolyngbya TaxID=2650499 RepID=UPI00168823E8|nr:MULTISPECIES: hypothetical protein [unclassified Leptolyngbya]MBD1868986.1 hypothetical protein [Cyanobacteria bacterium FACHB-471]MBD1997761.1 hypothetical protein [Leptolyngbya sp. FACHB-541]MBD2071839.1 hypothetical protein [Leptolyngbya sp. FACHB-671]